MARGGGGGVIPGAVVPRKCARVRATARESERARGLSRWRRAGFDLRTRAHADDLARVIGHLGPLTGRRAWRF